LATVINATGRNLAVVVNMAAEQGKFGGTAPAPVAAVAEAPVAEAPAAEAPAAEAPAAEVVAAEEPAAVVEETPVAE
jgi:large subunit ribosomal protein L10